MTLMICLWASIVVMPFVALLSLMLWFVAGANQLGLDRSAKTHRLPDRVKGRLRFAHGLWWVSIAEFWLLIVISWVWPQALNWW